MLTTMEVDVTAGLASLRKAPVRYTLLQRTRRSCLRMGLQLYAFGFGGRHLRLLVSGSALKLQQLSKGLKVACSNHARSQGFTWRSESTWLRVWHGSVLEGAVWVQRDVLPVGRRDALATPWTSHRDVLGLRRAPFFDPAPMRRAVDLMRLHEACSGGPVPRPPRQVGEGIRWDLHGLMRLSAAVHGVLPGRRDCFATFVQASGRCGASREAIGEALSVGPRRVRYYATQPARGVDAVLASLTDARLLRVP